MPKWVLQVIASCVMLGIIIAALYVSGKEAGTFDLLYDFLTIAFVLAYVIIIFCVNFDAEMRGSTLNWVAPASVFLGPAGALIWLWFRPKDYAPFPFAEDMEQEEPKDDTDTI